MFARAVAPDIDALPLAPRIVQRDVLAATPDASAAQLETQWPPRAPADLAERFLSELTRHRQERPKPLPTQFASIADLIVGNRKARISTGQASQRALASVNKVAATTGDVIHLAAPVVASTPSPTITGIIAHELTHVAAPSPAPRFFDDHRHTAEERRATEIGEIMRRSPAPPPAGSTAPRGGTRPMSMTQTAPTTQHYTRASVTDSPGTIRRLVDESSQGNVSSLRDRFGPAASGARGSGSSAQAQNVPESSGDAQESVDPQEFPNLLREHFDVIVELLEDRIISELERRGGRYRGEF